MGSGVASAFRVGDVFPDLELSVFSPQTRRFTRTCFSDWVARETNQAKAANAGVLIVAGDTHTSSTIQAFAGDAHHDGALIILIPNDGRGGDTLALHEFVRQHQLKVPTALDTHAELFGTDAPAGTVFSVSPATLKIAAKEPPNDR